MHKARLWENLQNSNNIQCKLCNHFCIIKDGEKGKCGVRINSNGELYSLVYDKVAAINIDPVEKKPLYHFLPGTKTLSLGTMGCNFSCVFCQNYSLSQPPRENNIISGEKVSPQGIIKAAMSYGCKSISFTYSEPTIFFELIEDIAKLAINSKLKCILVSNGFMTTECIERLKELIHGVNIDLKSFSDDFYKKLCGGRLKPVLKNLIHMKKLGWWVEITTLLIPGKNDSKQELQDIANFIHNELGEDTPWHISRFHPDYKLLDLSITPLKSLEIAYEIGKNTGLKYVYLGNVPTSPQENTYCPNCGELLIRRIGFDTEIIKLKSNTCINCSQKIAGVFE